MTLSTYTLNFEFCLFRIVADGTSVNTAITTDYEMLTIPDTDFQEVSDIIIKDIKKVMNKYRTKYQFQINE
ncbi:hypothetical protein LCGC14_1176920 [marine sediment metagenome]|uniref:Uncharacterized protein n=1 Tax=marine sediment metagenome TaxID=412755 RepID=A0A0F9MB09_9ZZZZ